MSQYSNNTIGFTIRIGGEIPKWMENMDLDELQRLAKRFTAIGQSSPNGSYVNGKYFSQQQLLQRGADYATAAEQKQTEADDKAREAERNKKEAEREKNSVRQQPNALPVNSSRLQTKQPSGTGRLPSIHEAYRRHRNRRNWI